jgi:hypothetical protein
MRVRKRIYLEPRAVERAHREATALARGARISHLFRVVDAFFGMVFACLLFVAGAWTLSTTGPLTSYEKAAIGDIYMKVLGSIETSAQTLQAAYCDEPGTRCVR